MASGSAAKRCAKYSQLLRMALCRWRAMLEGGPGTTTVMSLVVGEGKTNAMASVSA